jgi:hypothetical protein
MESALYVAVGVGWEQFGNPGRGTLAVGSQSRGLVKGQQTKKKKYVL